MLKKEISFSSMSLSEAEQNFIYSNFLNKEKVDDLKDAFVRKREQENNPKDTISFNGALAILIEGGHFISDERKFDLVCKFEGRQNCDFKDLLKMMCLLALHEERRENAENNFEYIDAFVAIGGNKDGSGSITPQQLERALEDFGLTIDVPTILEAFDIGEGNISYESFCKIFDKTIIEESKSVASDVQASLTAARGRVQADPRGRLRTFLPRLRDLRGAEPRLLQMSGVRYSLKWCRTVSNSGGPPRKRAAPPPPRPPAPPPAAAPPSPPPGTAGRSGARTAASPPAAKTT